MSLSKQVVALDFDGVIASYKGYKGAHVMGAPLPGAVKFLHTLIAHGYRVCIFSTRDKDQIRQWLRQYAPIANKEIYIVENKPSAHVFIDDRALTFRGKYPSIDEIKNFKPWWEDNEEDVLVSDVQE